MKRLLMLGLVLAGLAATAADAQAWGWGCCYGPPACYPCVTYQWVPENIKCTILVPRVVPGKRTILVYAPELKEVTVDVCCYRVVPMQCVDCCGCTYSCYRTEPYLDKRQCWVCVPKWVERVIDCPRVVYDQQVVDRVVYRCVAVPCPAPEVTPPPGKK